MNNERLYEVLGGIDDRFIKRADDSVIEKRSIRIKRLSVLAACMCFVICLSCFSVWFFVPQTKTEDRLQFTACRIDDRFVEYTEVNRLSRFTQSTLKYQTGELYRTHGGCEFYRVKGEEGLVHLIAKSGDGTLTLFEFCQFIYMTDDDVQTSYWYTSGWLTDDDISEMNLFGGYTLGEILKTVYNVTSPEDVSEIRFEKSPYGNSEIGKKVKIKTISLTDTVNITAFYNILISLKQTDSYSDRDTPVNANDERYKNGTAPLDIQTSRKITVKFNNGNELTLNYSPFRQMTIDKGVLFENINENANNFIISIAQIDMEYHYYGTEKAFTKNTASPNDETGRLPEISNP